MIYMLNRLLKRWTRQRQKQWAEATASRISELAPAGVVCKAAGWWPGNEPFTEWKELEWVDISVEHGKGCFLVHRVRYPQNPTVTELGGIFEQLMGG
jgi:hypothetical protein